MNEWISFNDWLAEDAKREGRSPIKIYKCMVCEVQYVEGFLPTIGHADGCCTVGSLIEVKEI